MTMHARLGGIARTLRTGSLVALAVAAIAGAGCDKGGGKGGSNARGMAGASAVAPNGGLSRALSMMPANSDFVVALDFAQLRGSGIWKKYEPMIMSKIGKGLEEFKAVCGWNPMDKATGILVGGRGKQGEDLTMFARGFDKAAVTDCIKKAVEKGKAEGKERVAVIDGDYVELQKADSADTLRFAFVDDQTIMLKRAGDAMAGKDVLMAAIAAKDKDGLMGSAAFSSVIDGTDTAATLWFVVNGNAGFIPPGLPDKPTAIFGSLTTSDGVAGVFKMRMANDGAASGLVSMGKMLMGQVKDTPYAEYLKAVTLESKGADVRLSFKLGQKQIEAMAGLAESMGGF